MKNTVRRDKLGEVFAKQSELIVKFHPIEASNGLLRHPDVPVPLDDPFGQAHLKELAWRVVEEMAEVYAVRHDMEKKEAELADALHFMVELVITSGLNHIDVLPGYPFEECGDMLDALFAANVDTDSLPEEFAMFIKDLGLAMNELKNRPWKQKRKPTDVTAYQTRIFHAFNGFIGVCRAMGMTAEKLHSRYMEKHAINEQRIADKV